MSEIRTRLGSYALVLAGVFGTAYAVGENLPGHDHDGADHGDDHGGGHDDGHGDGHGGGSTGEQTANLGLSAVVGADRLVVVERTDTSLALRIERDGEAITDVDEVHGADLHLIAVRRDLSGFQHVHPSVRPDGTWVADDLDLSTPGAWRVVAELRPAGDPTDLILGADVLVDGEAAVVPLDAPVATVDAGGTTVRLQEVGDGEIRFTASPADDLGPYLGQSAHLVAFRAGDLAYAHLHPTTDEIGDYRFGGSLPGPGTYRLFLQFTRDGEVVTVPFTIEVLASGEVTP